MISFLKNTDSNGEFYTIEINDKTYLKTIDINVSPQLENISPAFVLEVIADQFLEDTNSWYDIFEASKLKYPDTWTSSKVHNKSIARLRLQDSPDSTSLLDLYVDNKVIASNLPSGLVSNLIPVLESQLAIFKEFELYQVQNDYYIRSRISTDRYNGLYINLYNTTLGIPSDMHILDGNNIFSQGVEYNSTDILTVPLSTTETVPVNNPTALNRKFSV